LSAAVEVDPDLNVGSRKSCERPAAESSVLLNEISELDSRLDVDRLQASNDELRMQVTELKTRRHADSLLDENKRLLQEVAELKKSVGVPKSGCSGANSRDGLIERSLVTEEHLSLDSLREINSLDVVAEKRLHSLGLSSGLEQDLQGEFHGGRSLRGKKSGLDIVKNDCVVRYPQRCPHTHLKNEYAASNLKFRDLSMRLFVVGEVEIIATTLDVVERKGREALLQKILYHAGKFEWNFILDLYAAIIKAVEFGEKSWEDSFQDLEHMVLGMRPYALIRQHGDNPSKGNFGEKQQSQGQSQKVLFCAEYQKGECLEGDVHKAFLWGKQWVVRHICSKCWMSDKAMSNHRENSSCCPHLKADD
jgi:hypothetical protein